MTSPRNLEAGGVSTEGRELLLVTITEPWTPAQQAENEALERLLVEDPLAAAELEAAGPTTTTGPR